MTKRHRTISDGLAILDRRHFQGRPARLRALADARLNAQIAQEIYALRTKAGLTQNQLAGLVGTTHSVISRLEDADYAGHSLKMLQRISAALNRRLEVHFVPLRSRRKPSARSAPQRGFASRELAGYLFVENLANGERDDDHLRVSALLNSAR